MTVSKSFFKTFACIWTCAMCMFHPASGRKNPPSGIKTAGWIYLFQMPYSISVAWKQPSNGLGKMCLFCVCVSTHIPKNVLKCTLYNLIGWPSRLAVLFKGLRDDLERTEIQFDCQDYGFCGATLEDYTYRTLYHIQHDKYTNTDTAGAGCAASEPVTNWAI